MTSRKEEEEAQNEQRALNCEERSLQRHARWGGAAYLTRINTPVIHCEMATLESKKVAQVSSFPGDGVLQRNMCFFLVVSGPQRVCA